MAKLPSTGRTSSAGSVTAPTQKRNMTAPATQNELEALRVSHKSLQHKAAALQAGRVRLKAEAERAATRMAEGQQKGLALNRYLMLGAV